MSDDAESSSSSSSSESAAASAPPPPVAAKKSTKKRPSSSSSSSSNNNNNNNDHAACTNIEICVQKTNPAVDPVLCSFPSGLPSCLTGKNKSINKKEIPKFIWEAYNSSHVADVAAAAAATDKVVGGRSLMGQDHACLYTSRASVLDMKRRHTQVCVGIYDKKTNKLTIQPVACQGHVFALDQSVPAYNNNAGTGSSMNLGMAAENGRALFEDFGSAKKRKVLKSQQANRVTVDSVVGAGQGKVVATIVQGQSAMSESNRLALVAAQEKASSADSKKKSGSSNYTNTSAAVGAATEQWRSNFLPKYNLQAKEPFDVYSMPDIAGPSAWDRVMAKVTKSLADETDPIAAFLQGSKHVEMNAAAAAAAATATADSKNNDKDTPRKRSGPEWNPSTEQLIRTLVPRHGNANSSSDKMVQHQLACTVLLNYFVSLYRRLGKQRFIPPVTLDRPRYFGAPPEVGERWLQLFTTATTSSANNSRSSGGGQQQQQQVGAAGHVMSKSNRDKCHVHLFLLYLVATSGKSVQCADIKPLAQDLQLDLRDAMHLLRLAGCRANRSAGSTGKTSAALKVPLTFPPPPKRGGAKR